MASEKAVRKYVEQEGDDSIEGCYGPSRLDSLEVWEVWVWDKGSNEYMARFVIAEGDKLLKYCGDFSQYSAYVDSFVAQRTSEFNARLDKQASDFKTLWEQRTSEFNARLDKQASDFKTLWEQRENELKTQLAEHEAKSKDLADKLADCKRTERHSFIRLCVAAFVFIASAIVLFVLILIGIEPSPSSFAVFGSLIASGGYMFFRTWIQPQNG